MNESEKKWLKISDCQHQWSDDYCEWISCDTPYCHGTELHCKICKVYFSDCLCHSNYGYSGWSAKRWRNYWKKKQQRFTEKTLSRYVQVKK